MSAAILTATSSYAGNEDRVGSAGATELLINPWARSLAFADAGVASVRGLEATYTNIAGLAFTGKTQIKFNSTLWLGNSGVKINSVGIAQRISDADVITVGMTAFSFGEIDITQVDLPEGGIGTFKPNYIQINVGYARAFSNSIYGGINLKLVSENIANASAIGVAIDAGIQYVTGEKDQFKFGIALKNIGPKMKFKGDGFSYQVNYSNTGVLATLEQKGAGFEMPSCLYIGAAYDAIFNESNKLTIAAAFQANSFSYDNYRLGLNYQFKAKKVGFNVAAGYVFEKGIFKADARANALTGFTAGASIDVLWGKDKEIKDKSGFGIEYAMRLSNPFGVIHTFGVTFDLR
ncbi:MAG: PorV/PorQ family protein [Crocinitomicaceae bacterium]